MSHPILALLPRPAGPVVLRALRPDDIEAFHAYRSDPAVARYQGWSPMLRQQALAFLEEMAAPGPWTPGEWVQIGIARADDDRLVGDIGLLNEDAGQAQLGITLERAAQGRGWAQAAVQASCGLLGAHLGLQRLRAIGDSRNEASLRLLLRSGFVERGREAVVVHGEPCVDVVLERALPAAGGALPSRGPATSALIPEAGHADEASGRLSGTVPIVHLCELPHLRPRVAGMIHAEFWADVPGASAEAMEARLAQASRCDALPLCRVAVAGGEPLAVANLIDYDDPNPRVGTPWLAGLVVAPAWRGAGLGSRLVKVVLEDAHRLGHAQIFFGTDGPGFYRRLGAQVHQALRPDFWLMRFDLR